MTGVSMRSWGRTGYKPASRAMIEPSVRHTLRYHAHPTMNDKLNVVLWDQAVELQARNDVATTGTSRRRSRPESHRSISVALQPAQSSRPGSISLISPDARAATSLTVVRRNSNSLLKRSEGPATFSEAMQWPPASNTGAATEANPLL